MDEAIDALLPFWSGAIETDFRPEAQVVISPNDCANFLATLPRNSVKLIITSPPYNLGKSYEKATALEDYLKALDPIVEQLVGVLQREGSLCWQVGNYVENSEVFPLDVFYYHFFKRYHLKLRNRIIWHFDHGLHASKRFSGRYEVLLWFTKSDKFTFNLDEVRVPSKYPGKRHYKGAKIGQLSGNPLGKNPSDYWKIVINDWETALWEIPNVKNNHPEKTLHPCQFPIELVERCVLALTDPDDWVLDPFSGVGSALLAAVRHERRAIGCEREAQYVEIAHARFASLKAGRLPYRPMTRPVYEPTGREKISQMPLEWQRVKT